MPINLEIQIQAMEESLLQPDIRQSTEALNQLLSDDFLEYGVSGKLYTKKDILDHLPTEKDHIKVSLFDFELKVLCKDIVQALGHLYVCG